MTAKRALIASASAACLVVPLFWAIAIEPWTVLKSDVDVEIAGLPAAFNGYRLLHLSDFEASGPGARESQVEAMARAVRPDLIVVTGDLARKQREVSPRWRETRAMAQWLGSLPARDGVWFVQGHGEHAGALDEKELRGVLEGAGVRPLFDEVATITRGDSVLALAGVRVHEYADAGRWTMTPEPGVRQGPGSRPAWLEADEVGSSSWRDYEMTGRLRFSDKGDWIGVTAHGQLSAGKDRLYLVLFRSSRPFVSVSAHGTTFSEGVIAARQEVMPKRRWIRFRMRVVSTTVAVSLKARSWVEEDAEPTAWDIEYTDASSDRIESGPPGLYAEGAGLKEFTDLTLRHLDPGSAEPPVVMTRWIEPKGSDLLLSLRSLAPEGAPMVLLSHTPDIFPDAAELGIPLVLSGHTQGGQIRLPFIGALATDTRLGRRFASGLFRDGASSLFITRGVGTTRVPLRFRCPPEAAVITLRAAAP